LRSGGNFSPHQRRVSVKVMDGEPHSHGLDDHHDHGAHEEGESNFHRLRQLFAHDHSHNVLRDLQDTSGEGIRATKISLIGLGITAALQAVIVVFSGSVALLSDTIHNLADALTAIPLWIAFSLGRRRPTRSYTYGFHRAEDAAGLVIVLAIGASAALIIWESARRLVEPRLIEQIPWVIAAGLIGATGNELVARYRIRVGRRIGSEALVADGQHARADSLTSLAVVAAGIGAGFGAAWVDPVAGLVVAAIILGLLVRSTRTITRRLLDGVEPAVVDKAEAVIAGVEGVRGVTELKVRWQGHQLHVSASISVDPEMTVTAGHETAQSVEHGLHHAFDVPLAAVIHIDPHGRSDAHQTTAHHHR
jgi:cation diffusion facilitator family transporter